VIVEHKFSYQNPRPKKTAAVCRYGGIGDMMIAASIFPLLKRQGFHVTLYTGESGYEQTKHDPNIDEFYVQGREQVPNAALPFFWDNEKPKYDRWINLSETLECTWLADENRSASHGWPHSVRAKYLDGNYHEFAHDMAEVPHNFSFRRFHPTIAEINWAEKEREQFSKVVLWSLSGSAVHKRWPHLDAIVARIMLDSDAAVYLVGDDVCQILEAGWENEPRVIRRSGIWTIRETLSFALQADVVIGCETGVLNAVAHEPMRKVVMLSHSSHNNLTKHWKNTRALTPAGVPCYPCHRMHHNWDHCVQDKESKAAMCQVMISPVDCWEAIAPVLKRGK
jgi:ADP-heptose:LPS heptosyltransferase